jgi:putative heme-binding domain-containing protein
MRQLIIAMLGLVVSALASAQLANMPPVPEWIVAAGSEAGAPRTPGEAAGAPLLRSFEWSGKLLKAILLVASESEVEIVINGESVGRITGLEKATSVDVTRLMREGANTISLSGASPVAALLELNGDLANTRWIATDAAWTTAGAKVKSLGSTDKDATANPFDFKKTFDAYNSWQLAKPGSQNQATDPATITVPQGFKVELIRSAQPGEDSWVSMTFDPQGRIILGKEKKGLMRLKVGQPAGLPENASLQASGLHHIEHFAETLLECRGLLFVGNDLFANANNSKALYRLRDADGDGQFDEPTEILRTEGGVGHGRNHIKLGPDGKIYIAHGNNVLLPANVSPKSPLKNYADDQLLPNPWDGSMFDGNVELPAGHILRLNPDGSEVEVIAGGLRNPLDIAFNRAGELFTFDADMERDVGTPWYMPTRVLHVVPGADFGWRRGTGRFPAYYIDTLPSVVDIGLASPTATFFGYGARFPQKYQDAYFIMDWSYGRIIAVHLKAKGASYEGEQETFISGRPLNVTDGCIGQDGAMWFITGGRGTQSGLYRVSYVGRESTLVKTFPPVQKKEGIKSWTLTDLFPKGKVTPNYSMSSMSDNYPIWRLERRLDMERSPSGRWRTSSPHTCADAEIRSLKADQVNSMLDGILALARIKDVTSRNQNLSRLHLLLNADLPPEQLLDTLRVLAVTFIRLGGPSEAERTEWLRTLEPKFEGGATFQVARNATWKVAPLYRELCRMLVYLRSPTVIEKTLPLLREATSSEDLLFYPFILRYLKDGWTLEARRVCFEALNRAEKLNGASTYFKAIADTRSELAAALSPEDAKTLAAVIYPPKPAALSPHALPGHTFKIWKLEDFDGKLDAVAKGRSLEKARAALISTQCVFCHKVANDPTLPVGVFGPDLTQVSARFNRRDLLMHILEPSKFVDEKFRPVTITKTDGTTANGALESEDDERVVLKPNPLAPETIEIGKSMIRERKVSEISPMPAGLLNSLKLEQILDMLAWFEAQGDAGHAVFER